MIHVNDYTVDLFNGDDGVVLGSCSYFHSEEGIRKSPVPDYRNWVGYATTITVAKVLNSINRCTATGRF